MKSSFVGLSFALASIYLQAGCDTTAARDGSTSAGGEPRESHMQASIHTLLRLSVSLTSCASPESPTEFDEHLRKTAESAWPLLSLTGWTWVPSSLGSADLPNTSDG
jgi:hypothetical protein